MFFYIQLGVNPPADIASGRIAEVRRRSMSCNCMTRTSAARMPRHSCLRRWLVIKEVEIISGL